MFYGMLMNDKCTGIKHKIAEIVNSVWIPNEMSTRHIHDEVRHIF